MNRTDFQQLADLRIAEAAALLSLPIPMPDGAYYLAGYAVECALKACISKNYSAEQWPEKDFVNKCHTHDVDKMVEHAVLKALRDAAAVANPPFANNWIIVKDWDEASRYERHTLAKAQRLYEAVSHPTEGVLQWVKAHW